ncbi:MAG: histidine phosphatase family protein [Burkholderiaceae bacterium]|jgi:phosphohistidine phosphatase SixA|nr:histidine phosphatase family protein [Burkholderiaceae bacterium]
MNHYRAALRIMVLLLCLTGLPAIVHADALGKPPPAAAKFVEIRATPQTLEQLRQGGFVLYLRHGFTDNSKGDRPSGVDLNDCATQRPLSPAGVKVAAQVGDAIRQAKIPIGEIRVSPLCRVRDTVDQAFPGVPYTVDNNLMYTANFTTAEKAPIIANTRKLLSAPVAAGTNRLLIAHAPNIMDLIGYFPKEATLVIFHPNKSQDGFEYIASIPPGQWADLLQAATK